jgi:hypothetical protein
VSEASFVVQAIVAPVAVIEPALIALIVGGVVSPADVVVNVALGDVVRLPAASRLFTR